MYHKIKHYCALVFYTLALFPATLIALTYLTRLFYKCSNSYLVWAIVLSALILAWVLSLRLQKLKRSVSIAVYSFFISLVIGSMYLSIFNCARCITPESNLNYSLRHLIVIAERSYLNYNYSYKSLCEDSLLIDTRSNIQSQMLRNGRRCYGPILNYLLPEKSVDNLFVCNADDESYAVEAYLHISKKYLCVDNRSEVMYSDKSIGEATSCSN